MIKIFDKIKNNFTIKTLFFKFCYEKSKKYTAFLFVFSYEKKWTKDHEFRRSMDTLEFDPKPEDVVNRLIYSKLRTESFSSSIFKSNEDNILFNKVYTTNYFKKNFHFESYEFDSWYITLIASLFLFVGCLVFTAAFTLYERKLMGLFQRREGPDKVGIEGIGQPFADGLKLLAKETLIPRQTPAPAIFYIAPIISLSISLLVWSIIPLSSAGAIVNSDISILLALGVSSVGSYGVIYAGWASNNKYALLGSLRAVSQFISYEVVLSLLFLPSISIVQSMNFNHIVDFQNNYGWFIYQMPIIIIFSVVMLAETNRTPFDLPEAEAELVSGFNVEYSSLLFSLFFLAEYCSMGFMSALFVIFFMGGWSYNPFGTINTTKSFSSIFSSDIKSKSTPFDLLFERETRTLWDTPGYMKVDTEDNSEEIKKVIKQYQIIIKEKNEPQPSVKKIYRSCYFKEDGNPCYISKIKPRPQIYDIFDSLHFDPFVTQRFKDTKFDKFNTFYNFSNPNFYGHAFQHNLNNIKIVNTYYWNFFEFSIFQDSFFFISIFIFTIKVIFVSTFFIFVRAALPRKRFDQLINLCWKYLFPLTLAVVIWSISLYIIFFTWKVYNKFPIQNKIVSDSFYTQYYTGSVYTWDKRLDAFYIQWLRFYLETALLTPEVEKIFSTELGISVEVLRQAIESFISHLSTEKYNTVKPNKIVQELFGQVRPEMLKNTFCAPEPRTWPTGFEQLMFDFYRILKDCVAFIVKNYYNPTSIYTESELDDKVNEMEKLIRENNLTTKIEAYKNFPELYKEIQEIVVGNIDDQREEVINELWNKITKYKE
jgi:NADH-quinone oxidoreductase subunit H